MARTTRNTDERKQVTTKKAPPPIISPREEAPSIPILPSVQKEGSRFAAAARKLSNEKPAATIQEQGSRFAAATRNLSDQKPAAMIQGQVSRHAAFNRNDNKKTTEQVTESMATFGFSPVKSPSHGIRPPAGNKHALRCAVITTTDIATIAFRCESFATDKNCFTEKMLLDAIRDNKDWCKQLSFKNFTLPWFHHNERQDNCSNYAVRLFFIEVDKKEINEPKIKRLAEHICTCLNKGVSKNGYQIRVPSNLFWIPFESRTVWSDIIGDTESLQQLEAICGKAVHDGYYEKNADVIHTYFRRQDLTPEVAFALYAPQEMIMPHMELQEGKKRRITDMAEEEQEVLQVNSDEDNNE